MDIQKERKKFYDKKYRLKNKNRIRGYHKMYRKKNKEKLNLYNQKYYSKNKPILLLKQKEYTKKQEVNLRRKVCGKKYYLQNKEKIINKTMKTQIIKYHTNPKFNITCRLKRLVLYSLKNYTKTGKVMNSKKYGINYYEIIEYLKPLPKNLSLYHIHHIKPLFTFNFVNEDGSTNLEEIKKAFAPENHKLLTIEEHRKLNHRKLANGS